MNQHRSHLPTASQTLIHGFEAAARGEYVGGTHFSTVFQASGEPISPSRYPELANVIEETALFHWQVISYRGTTTTGECVVRSVHARQLEETFLAQAMRQRRCGYATKMWCARLPAQEYT